jgi:hypothetical protein
MVTIKSTGVDKIPTVGGFLNARVSLPGSFAPLANRSGFEGGISILQTPGTLGIDAKPRGPADLVPVVQALASVEAVAFLSRLSKDEFSALVAIGKSRPDTSTQQLDILDALAEKFLLVQGKQITTLNLIGPDSWKGVLRTPDLSVGKSYRELSDGDRTVASNNVFVIAAALTSLPPESLQIIQDLKYARPGIASFVDPISTLSDRVIKRAVGSNFDAWKMRKALERADHTDAQKTIHELEAPNRLFAGLMGLGTFQMLRDHGVEVCNGLIALGQRVKDGGKLVSLEKMNAALNLGNILTALPFKDGSLIGLQTRTIQHLAEAHHDIWVMNRAISSLLPEELRQPERQEHRPFGENTRPTQNQSCIHILALAVALAHEAQKGGMVDDLLRSAAPGNPLGLDMTIRG